MCLNFEVALCTVCDCETNHVIKLSRKRWSKYRARLENITRATSVTLKAF